MAQTSGSAPGAAAGEDDGNQVRLRGRLSADPVLRDLPSGGVLLTFRLVVPRSPTPMTRGSKQRVDWVGCTVWSAGLRRRCAGWRVGDVVEVEGALRRRYFHGRGGVGSQVEVEVLGGRRRRRGGPGAAGPAPP